jgi:hypothetical protein
MHGARWDSGLSYGPRGWQGRAAPRHGNPPIGTKLGSPEPEIEAAIVDLHALIDALDLLLQEIPRRIVSPKKPQPDVRRRVPS